MHIIQVISVFLALCFAAGSFDSSPAVKQQTNGIQQNMIIEQTSSQDGLKKNTTVTKPQMDGLKAELKRTGVTMETVKDRYKIQNPDKMSEELYKRVMTALAKTKSIGAA